MDDLTEEEKAVVAKTVCSDQVKDLIGAGEWNLTYDEEVLLWSAIKKLEGLGCV